MSLALKAGPGATDQRAEELRLAAVLRRGFRHAQLLMAHSLAEHGLSALTYHLLLEVGAAGPQGVIQGDLADLLQCPPARVSMLVRDLLDRGLVRAARAAPDRRVVRIHCTELGEKLAEAALRSQRLSLNSLSGYAGLPSVTSLLQDALRLYLGVELHLEGMVAAVSPPVGRDGRPASPTKASLSP